MWATISVKLLIISVVKYDSLFGKLLSNFSMDRINSSQTIVPPMAGAMKSKLTGTTRPRIGILGTGRVARALATGLVRTGHQVQLGSRQPGKAHANEADFQRGVSTQTQREA